MVAPTLIKIQIDEGTRAHAVKMALVHDLAEAIVGDITPSDGVPKGKIDHFSRNVGLIYHLQSRSTSENGSRFSISHASPNP
jgi:hypothetical protein